MNDDFNYNYDYDFINDLIKEANSGNYSTEIANKFARAWQTINNLNNEKLQLKDKLSRKKKKIKKLKSKLADIIIKNSSDA